MVFAHGKDSLIIRLALGQQVENGSSQFVSSDSVSLGSPHLGAHAAIEAAAASHGRRRRYLCQDSMLDASAVALGVRASLILVYLARLAAR